MKRDMVKLREKLSMEIFSRRFGELDTTQQTFVDYHVGGYHTYVKKVAPILRQTLKKKLRKEYDTILDLYCLRLPPGYFLAAVDDSEKKAMEREEVIYSVNYIQDHFRRYIERYRKNVVEKIKGRIDVDVDFPWFFNIFRYIRENDTDFIFSPFWGFREREKRRKKKPPVELQIVLKMREIDTVENMIERLQQLRVEYPKRKERIKTLKRKKKRMQQQIKELREKVDVGN